MFNMINLQTHSLNNNHEEAVPVYLCIRVFKLIIVYAQDCHFATGHP